MQFHHQKDKRQSSDIYYVYGFHMGDERQVLEYESQKEKPTQTEKEQCRQQQRNENQAQAQKEQYKQQINPM